MSQSFLLPLNEADINILKQNRIGNLFCYVLYVVTFVSLYLFIGSIRFKFFSGLEGITWTRSGIFFFFLLLSGGASFGFGHYNYRVAKDIKNGNKLMLNGMVSKKITRTSFSQNSFRSYVLLFLESGERFELHPSEAILLSEGSPITLYLAPSSKLVLSIGKENEKEKSKEEQTLARMAGGIQLSGDKEFLLQSMSKDELHNRLKQMNPRDYYDGDGF
ncbi:hypothetical protein [Leptospira sp. 'Mane']|uniref:hypothetical protein n=1 Tax=Leptospira sp. 'Mane' TaxID=3387407 RepID=UPI00398B1944